MKERTMRLSKVTSALVAAGLLGGVATYYNQLDSSPIANAFAAAQPTAVVAPAVAPTAAANLPDFTALVDRTGVSVVNISVVHGKGGVDAEGIDEDSPYYEFFKRFGGIPNGPGMRPQQPSQGMGSGFIVTPDGYIVTNAHVVDGADEVTVKLTDRREFTAKVIGTDKRTDIALIKIDAKNLPALELSGRPGVKRGEWVIAIGSPFGFENSVSAGVVSGVHRALPNGQMVPFIQTDVAVNPGNSGGPLLNAAGQVVGVNSQIYSRSGGYMGLSFAIPVDVAAKVADQLKTHGKVMHGRLGISIQPLNQTLAQSFGLTDANGALVGSVEDDSPAAKAGFKQGDVIRKIDGVVVSDSTDVTSRIGNTAPGTDIKVEVWRSGKPVELAAKVGTLDEGKIAKADYEALTKGKLGVAVRALTPEERKESGKTGLVVEKAGGAAAKAGVQPGDLIVGVGSSKVNTVDELKSQIDKSGKTVALLIERQGRQIYVPVKIG
ncbi:MAG: Do family serine endopeptidase [Burkholderiales bacterium]|nr:Do family serine endopeptidase [Burkholderiales bacterium]